ncbi:MAG: hypothetical protein IPK07_33055 [Deltaproteobacteria bacterium]|nr:hypothetical protein [Deltaproteobacteria bacterium]
MARAGRLARARSFAGYALLAASHAPPFSLLWALPAAALAARVTRWRTSRPVAAWTVRALYYVAVAACAALVQAYIPYTRRSDVAYVALVCAGCATWLRAGAGAAAPTRWAALALVIGGFQLVSPPLGFALGPRLAIAASFALGTAAFLALVGREVLRSGVAVGVAVALAVGGVRARQWIFYNLPGGPIAATIEKTPGVRFVPIPVRGTLEGLRLSPTPAINWNIIVAAMVESCDRRSYLMGGLSVTRLVPVAGGAASEELDEGFSRFVWLDCAHERLLTGNFQPGQPVELIEVGFHPLRVLRRAPYCSERATDTVRVDEARGTAWWVDDTGDVYGVDLASLACVTHVDTDFARDVAIDPASGDLFILDLGHVRRWSLAEQAFVADVRLPARFTWPGRVGHRLGQLVLDDERQRLIVSDMNGGTVSFVRTSDLVLERSVVVGLGARHLALDPRRGLVYVGNFLSGDLLALSRDDLSERRRGFVGTRIQPIALSRDGERLTFLDESGGVVVDLDRFLAPS